MSRKIAIAAVFGGFGWIVGYYVFQIVQNPNDMLNYEFAGMYFGLLIRLLLEDKEQSK